LLGHKWKGFTPSLWTKRECKRCGIKQKWEFNDPVQHSSIWTLGKWVDVK